MKKSTKALLMAALCMALTGGAFCIAGFCFGFTFGEFRTAVENGQFQMDDSSKKLEKVSSLLENTGSGIKNITTDTADFTHSFSEIKSLDLEFTTAECRLQLWDGDHIKVEGRNLPSSFQCRKDGDELEINCSESSWKFWNKDGGGAELTLFIPQDHFFEQVRIDTGVGNLSMEDGYLICEEIQVDSGVGDCSLNLDVREKLDMNGGVGDISLELKGKEEDFDYDLDLGVGEVTIGNLHVSDMGYDEQIDNGASKEIAVDSGVGSVEIIFEE